MTQALHDPDGILDTLPDPGPDALPDPVDVPHRVGDPFEMPDTTWKSSRRDALGLGLDPQEAAAKLAALSRDPRGDKYQPREIAPPPPEPDPAQVRLDRLRYLARWVPATANLREIVDRAEAAAEGIVAGGKKVPPALRATIDAGRARLADALERDAIAATRPPGCHCLGSGAYGSSSHLLLVEPGDPASGAPPKVLYSEGTAGPEIYGVRCDACPEGLAYRDWLAGERDAMRLRMAAHATERLLGAAHIPARLAHLTLETYPYPDKALRLWRWYATNAREARDGTIPRSLRPFLLASGPNRRGKTGLAVGLMKRAIAQGTACVSRTIPKLLTELKATYDKDNPACFSDLLAALQAAPLLILDDLGAEQLTENAIEILYALLDHRANELMPTVLTTNLSWKKRDPDDPNDRSELARWVGQRLYMRIRPNANLLDFGDVPILALDVDPEPVDVSPPDAFEEW